VLTSDSLLRFGLKEVDFFGNLARSAAVEHVAVLAVEGLQRPATLANNAPMDSGLTVDSRYVADLVENVLTNTSE
jgi:hypothetical protein